MKSAVIYRSQTGFTKQYAEWISEEIKGDCFAFDKVKSKDFSEYDAIVFGGWCCAGGIQKLNWFKENLPKWEGKKLAVFAVGASPIENPDVEPTLRHNFTDEQWNLIKVAYCPGGLRYDTMPASSRILMKMFAKSIQNKKNKTPEEEGMAKMIGSSYDISDRKYIKPIVTYICE